MGQIAQQITGCQAQGTLTSTTMTNPRDHNNVSIVMARSEKTTKSPKDKSAEEDHLLEVDLEIKDHRKSREEVATPKVVGKEKKKPKLVIRLPYPQREKKKDQNENNFEKFLEMFKKLQITYLL